METSSPREFENVRIQVPWGYMVGRWYGEKNVRPILAMHGWLDNNGTWDTLIPLMPSHLGVLAIDLPGHGKSSRFPAGISYHVIDYVNVIIRVMKEYNWDKVSILAHSMSAINSFIYTALCPDKVDMLIQIDVIHPRHRTPEQSIYINHRNLENFLLEEKRMALQQFEEPPSYSYDDLVERIYEGSSRSIDKDKCEHILRSNVTKSKRYPSKYYFSRDRRVTHYMELFPSPKSSELMAKRIKIPQLVIKGSDSTYINLDDPVIQVLRDNNPYFEFHVLNGTHHVHLNNPQETSALVNAFINKWRPPAAPEEKQQPKPQSWVEKRNAWKLQRSKL